MTPPFLGVVATLAVSTIFLLWHYYQVIQAQKERVRRGRIAFLLWAAAHHAR